MASMQSLYHFLTGANAAVPHRHFTQEIRPMSAPRVSLEAVNAAIIDKAFVVMPDGRTTICQLTLDNGFTVRGESSCVCIENFDPQIGQEIAERNATDKVWMLLGFRLADQIHLDNSVQTDHVS